MTALNKQALRQTAEKAQEHGVFNMDIHSQTLLALLDELEHYKSREDRVTKLVLDNSTSWDELYKKLEAAEKRMAELEARIVTLPQYRNSPDMHTKQFYEAIGFNQGLDIIIEALRAAGIGVKEE
nr:ead/Ea22-like family protein [Citrobacter freundii]